AIRVGAASTFPCCPDLTAVVRPHACATIHCTDEQSALEQKRRSNLMKPLVAPVIPFEHRRALSWPSCPWCGQLCPFADVAEYVHGTIRNEWCCESCYERFETVVPQQLRSH